MARICELLQKEFSRDYVIIATDYADTRALASHNCYVAYSLVYTAPIYVT